MTDTLFSIRLSAADMRLCEQIKAAMGVSKNSEVLRMGLHCLAKREGLKPTDAAPADGSAPTAD